MRRVVIICLVCLSFMIVGLFAVGRQEVKASVDELMETGYQNMLNGDYEECILMFSEVLTIDEHHIMAKAGLIVGYIGNGKEGAGLRVFEDLSQDFDSDEILWDMIIESHADRVETSVIAELAIAAYDMTGIKKYDELVNNIDMDREGTLSSNEAEGTRTRNYQFDELEVVSFESPEFETLIREMIGRPNGEIIAGDLFDIKEISIFADNSFEDDNVLGFGGNQLDLKDGTSIRAEVKGSLNSLEDLKWFPNLVVLNVNYCQISDISGLQYTPYLTELNLMDNEITDIDGLRYLEEDFLQILRLRGNKISDISSLSKFTYLEILWLDDNRISDLEPLGDFKYLSELGLSGNEITDISELESLKECEYLWFLILSDNKITDLGPIRDFPGVTFLRFDNNSISDLSPIGDMTSITSLHFSNNLISDISVLENLSQLRFLSVDNNPIEDYYVLEQLPNLERY